MARVTDVFVSGTLENIVLYRRMGKSCARIKRDHIHQTAATKIRSFNFGIASRTGKALRHGLHAVIPFPTDRSMQSRFSGAIARWLRLSDIDELPPCNAANYISAFQFTTGAAFNERFKVPVSVKQPQSNLITVGIDAFVPAIKIAAPANTVSVNCIISVAGCLLKSGTATDSVTHSILIPYNDIEIPAQVLEFHIPILAASLTVTAARLEYNVIQNNVLNKTGNTAFMPAGILNAMYC